VAEPQAAGVPVQRRRPTLAICICGTPVRSPETEAAAPLVRRQFAGLWRALERNSRWRQLDAEIDALASQSRLAALVGDLARLEHSCRVLQRRLLPHLAMNTPVRPPRRPAATHGLDAIALDLQRRGLLTFRQAHQVVRVVVGAWRAALVRGEPVRTPAGTLAVQVSRSGVRRIVLRPKPSLCVDDLGPVAQRTKMTTTENDGSSTRCPRCGSEWFVELEFHRYDTHSYSPLMARALPLSGAQVARICVCGMPIQSKVPSRGRRLTAEEQSFRTSWEKALALLEWQAEAEERICARLREAANADYVQQLAARVESARTTVASLAAEFKGRHLKPRRRRRSAS